MMRAGSVVTMLGMALVLAPGMASGQGSSCSRVAYVASNAILQATPGYADAAAQFQKEYDGFRNQVMALNAKLDSASAALEQKSVMLSATAKQAEAKRLQASKDSVDQQTADLQQKAAQRRDDLLKPYEDRIQAVIDGLRAEGNFCMIFDVTATGSGVLSADKSLDLTQKAIDRLKAGAGKGGGL